MLPKTLVNLNKLFPRLSIRAKLIIAFAGLSVLPLMFATAIGAFITVQRIRQVATQTLVQDLARTEVQTTRSLREAERHVTYLAREVLGPALDADAPDRWAAAAASVGRLLGPEPAFHAIKVVDADGRVRFASPVSARDGLPEESGVYYAWRAAETAADAHAIFPVEVRETDRRGASAQAIPAIAILVPLRARDGRLRGAVVGEAYAAEVLAAIEDASPGYEGVTGLVDSRGVYLYHSARKRDWASRLVDRPSEGLTVEFGDSTSRTVLSGVAGSLRSAGRIIGFRPLPIAGSTEPLTVYRSVPLTVLERPVRRFLGWTLVATILVTVGVLVLGLVAADQFTRPIYRMRSAAEALAGGGEEPHLGIETNDEIEDLANAFERMGGEIVGHRRGLERLVAERTRELEVAHAELATVLEGSADAIVGLDTEGRVRFWNRGATSLLGWDEDEVLGRDHREFVGPFGPGAEGERAFIARTLEDEGALVNFQTMRRQRDGTPLPVSLTQTVLCDGDGCGIGSSLIVRDNRSQARLDDHMRRSERLAAVAVMATGLAHEIRNPLGIITNRIECMQRDAADRADAALVRDLEVLAAHVDRLRTLTTDLLRFARDEDDGPGPVALDVVAARLVALLRRTFVARSLQLDCAADPDVPPVVGREGALEAVLLNLLLNAADATPAGGRVAVSVRRADDSDAVEVLVRDTGDGIPPEVRSRIFEPFFTTKGPRGGTGLGLAVCRTVVERHGGTIRVASAPGAGSSFTVTLPRRPAGAA